MAEKMQGEARRKALIHELQHAERARSGRSLGEQFGVSRQVIVQDMTLLKAQQHPITATSQGYVWNEATSGRAERILACVHPPERTEEELLLLVDHGVTVKDVRVEHPVYGDLRASIMVKNRRQVQQFLEQVRRTEASYLSELTDGIHLHAVEADTEDDLQAAVDALAEAGFLIEERTD
ncbi:transcription repressor NadR [Alkalicoccus chagannorensis]|uniref:transcription repressor NadR n=1 Tax=Alkalicoccus chagannorensis TaxID=427072 RepID=UPI0003F6AEFD|nr:transcription repressor NadR [Alkalicoccus chagannorensis]